MAADIVDLSHLEPQFNGEVGNERLERLDNSNFQAEVLIERISRRQPVPDHIGLFKDNLVGQRRFRNIGGMIDAIDFSEVDIVRRKKVTETVFDRLERFGLDPEGDDERLRMLREGAARLVEGKSEIIYGPAPDEEPRNKPGTIFWNALSRVMDAAEVRAADFPKDVHTLALSDQYPLKKVSVKRSDLIESAFALAQLGSSEVHDDSLPGILVGRAVRKMSIDGLSGVTIETMVVKADGPVGNEVWRNVEITLPTSQLHEDDIREKHDSLTRHIWDSPYRSIFAEGYLPLAVVVQRAKYNQPWGKMYDTVDGHIQKLLGIK